MERRLDLLPAEDTRDRETLTGTVRGCTIRFTLSDDLGNNVSFDVQTNWHLPHAAKQFWDMGNWQMLLPFAKAITVNGRQHKMPDEVYDRMYQAMIEHGEEGVFRALARFHDEIFKRGMRIDDVIEADIIEDDATGVKLLP